MTLLKRKTIKKESETELVPDIEPEVKEVKKTPSEIAYEKAQTNMNTSFTKLNDRITQINASLLEQTKVLQALVKTDKDVHAKIEPEPKKEPEPEPKKE